MTYFLDRLNELPFFAERFDIIDITNIVNVGDERNVGIRTAGDSKRIGYRFLELNEGIHISSSCSKHII